MDTKALDINIVVTKSKPCSIFDGVSLSPALASRHYPGASHMRFATSVLRELVLATGYAPTKYNVFLVCHPLSSFKETRRGSRIKSAPIEAEGSPSRH
jgi:hypothetical protein